MVRGIGAMVAGAAAWEAVVMLATFAGRLFWPAYAAVEMRRGFTFDMLISRLAIGAVATLVFGAVVAAIARGEKRTISVILALWLTYSVVDHYTVWDKFPVWYPLTYLGYIVPLVLLGAELAERAKGKIV